MESIVGIWNYLITNVANAILMTILFAFLFWSLNKLTPKVDFQEQLKNGNLAVALLLVGFAIAFAMVLRA